MIDGVPELALAPPRTGMTTGILAPNALARVAAPGEASGRRSAVAAKAYKGRKANSDMSPATVPAAPWYRRFAKR